MTIKIKNKLFEYYEEVKRSKYFIFGTLSQLVLFLIFVYFFYFGYVRTHVPYFRNMLFSRFQLLGYVIFSILGLLLYVVNLYVFALIYWWLDRKSKHSVSSAD